MDDHNTADNFQTTEMQLESLNHMNSFLPLIKKEAELKRQFPSRNELKQDIINLRTSGTQDKYSYVNMAYSLPAILHFALKNGLVLTNALQCFHSKYNITLQY